MLDANAGLQAPGDAVAALLGNSRGHLQSRAPGQTFPVNLHWPRATPQTECRSLRLSQLCSGRFSEGLGVAHISVIESVPGPNRPYLCFPYSRSLKLGPLVAAGGTATLIAVRSDCSRQE